MRRAAAVLLSSVFLVAAPGTVAGLIPWWISRWRFETPLPRWLPMRIAGLLLMAAALPVLLDSFARFALEGFGTPAPVFPTRQLVVTGFYRRVRNPIYVAVVSLILGQALLFGDARVLAYAVLVWFSFHIFVLTYEEPIMRKTFPQEYAAFFKNVPRWIPRLSAWRGAATFSEPHSPNSTGPHRR